MTALLAALAVLGPIVVHDARESSPLGSVVAAGRIAGGEPVVYERIAPARAGGRWRQWWLAFPQNAHDRGVLRTGRHAGDWEFVQVREDASGQPLEAVYAQHSGAERCPWSAVRTRGGRPVVYLANGSHAAYFRPGVRDRMWPDPNDEAGGDGSVVQPRVVRVTAGSPAWMRWRGRWGAARAGWMPGEQSSPLGPAFQPQGRWSDPDGWAARARGCMFERCDSIGECDGRETAALLAVPLVLVGLVAVWWRRRTSGS